MPRGSAVWRSGAWSRDGPRLRRHGVDHRGLPSGAGLRRGEGHPSLCLGHSVGRGRLAFTSGPHPSAPAASRWRSEANLPKPRASPHPASGQRCQQRRRNLHDEASKPPGLDAAHVAKVPSRRPRRRQKSTLDSAAEGGVFQQGRWGAFPAGSPISCLSPGGATSIGHRARPPSRASNALRSSPPAHATPPHPPGDVARRPAPHPVGVAATPPAIPAALAPSHATRRSHRLMLHAAATK